MNKFTGKPATFANGRIVNIRLSVPASRATADSCASLDHTFTVTINGMLTNSMFRLYYYAPRHLITAHGKALRNLFRRIPTSSKLLRVWIHLDFKPNGHFLSGFIPHRLLQGTPGPQFLLSPCFPEPATVDSVVVFFDSIEILQMSHSTVVLFMPRVPPLDVTAPPRSGVV